MSVTLQGSYKTRAFFILSALIIIITILMSLSFILTQYKEVQDLWTEQSHIRSITYYAYYPLLLLNFILCLGFSTFILQLLGKIRLPNFLILSLISSAFWIFLCIIVWLLISNNLSNIMWGESWHNH